MKAPGFNLATPGGSGLPGDYASLNQGLKHLNVAQGPTGGNMMGGAPQLPSAPMGNMMGGNMGGGMMNNMNNMGGMAGGMMNSSNLMSGMPMGNAPKMPSPGGMTMSQSNSMSDKEAKTMAQPFDRKALLALAKAAAANNS